MLLGSEIPSHGCWMGETAWLFFFYFLQQWVLAQINWPTVLIRGSRL